MVNRFFYICFILLISIQLYTQEFNYKKLLRAGLSISPGYLFKEQSIPVYISGESEYYFSEKFSWKNELYYFVNETSTKKFLKTNHQLYSGLNYHFRPNQQMDLFTSVQIGVALTQATDSLIMPSEREFLMYHETANPVYSLTTGVNYFAPKWFHIFLSLKYVHGVYTSMAPPLSLDEVRIMFGLGFNLSLLRH